MGIILINRAVQVTRTTVISWLTPACVLEWKCMMENRMLENMACLVYRPFSTSFPERTGRLLCEAIVVMATKSFSVRQKSADLSAVG